MSTPASTRRTSSSRRATCSRRSRNPFPTTIGNGAGEALYQELTEAEKAYIGRKMVARGVTTPRDAITSGAFLAYAEPQTIRGFFSSSGTVSRWQVLGGRLLAIDYGAADVTEEARDFSGRATTAILPTRSGSPASRRPILSAPDATR